METYAVNIPLVEGRFLRRPNRFVVYIEIDGVEYGASMPNPGRMQEHLFVGTTMLVTPMDPERVKYPYRVVGIISQGEPILLDTLKANDVAAWLVQHHKVPSLASWELERREVVVGKSRFDLLLRRGEEKLFCEVKACTLFQYGLGMFPDAVTSRGARHIEELGEMAREGQKTAILILLHSSSPKAFVPDFHNDPHFAQVLYEQRKDLQIIPLTLGWTPGLSLQEEVREVPVAWDLFERHGQKDRGIYLIMLEIAQDTTAVIGSLGERFFKKGFYCYVGSAKRGLLQRIARHRRHQKGMHWHIDYVRALGTVKADWPIRRDDVEECHLAQDIRGVADDEMVGLGSSDCHCPSHLFYFEKNPIRTAPFQEVVLRYRMDFSR